MTGAEAVPIPPYIRALIELWPLVTVISACILGGAMLYLGTKFVRRADCDRCRSEITTEQEGHAARLEEGMRQFASTAALVKVLPNAKSLSDLEISLERLTGRLRELEATVGGQRDLMKRVERQLDRVDDYLRQQP